MKKKKSKMKKIIANRKVVKRGLNAEKQALLNSILKYSEGIAYNYYLKHFRIFANDALSIHDLYQEAKIICLAVFKKYGSNHGKNGFDIKKFIARAVGWRMRDLMRQAITESQVIFHQIHPSKNIPKAQEEAVDLNEAVLHKYDNLSPELLYGFNIQQIFNKLDEKDLTVLKFMLKYKGEKHDYTKFFKNSKLMHIYWMVKVKPKLRRILSKYKNEVN